MSQRITLEEFLLNRNDISSQEFWRSLKSVLRTSHDDGHFPTRLTPKVKALFTESHHDPERISTISLLLHRCPKLSAGFIKEIAAILLDILDNSSHSPVPEEYAFVKSVTELLYSNPGVSTNIASLITIPFQQSLTKNLDSDVISALFELQIHLIVNTNKQINYNQDSFKNAISLLLSINDSVSQRMIVEWLWRLRDQIRNPKRLFGKRFDSFRSINSHALSSTIHSFIRDLNSKSKQVLHAPFTLLNEQPCQGYLDLNQTNVALWLFEKPANYSDAYLFHINKITNAKATSRSVLIESKESFAGLSQPITLDIIAPKGFVAEFNRRCHGVAMVKAPAEKPQRHFAPRTGEIAAALSKSQKTTSINDELTLFAQQAEQEFKEFAAGLQDQLALQQRRESEARVTLTQILEAHRDITDTTRSEAETIAKSLRECLVEFEEKHQAIVEARTSVREKTVADLQAAKQEYLESADDAFSQNILVGFVNSINTLQPVC